MVSIVWATIAASLGFLGYVSVAFASNALPIQLRKRVGTAYLKMASRCLKQFTFVRRVLSGYDVLPIAVDAEQKLLKVTLSSSVIASDKEFQFKDPDNRIKRLFNKPVAVNYEEIPAAVDPELAELGYWTREHDINSGLLQGDRVDPYVPMSSELRLVDPIDAFELVSNDVTPENIKTAEELTKKRYEKYGSRVGLAETVGTLMGFAVGLGGVAAVQYLNQNILDGSGSGGSSGPIVNLGMAVPDVPLITVFEIVMVML